MFRQGVSKRGEAISPGSKKNPSTHHTAVHSILHGKRGGGSQGSPSSPSSSSSPSTILSRKKSHNNSSGSSGGGNNNNNDNSANNKNYHRVSSGGGGSDEGSTTTNTSLTIGSNGSWKKRSLSSPRKANSNPKFAIGGGVVAGGGGLNNNNSNADDGGSYKQQFSPPPRPFSNSFTAGEKRSYSFDVGKQQQQQQQQQQDGNNTKPGMMKSKSFNAAGGARGAGVAPYSSPEPSNNHRRGNSTEPPGSSPPTSPTENKQKKKGSGKNKKSHRSKSAQPSSSYPVSNEDNRNYAEAKKHLTPPPYYNRPDPPQISLSSSDSDRYQIQHSIQQAVDMRDPTTQSGSNENDLQLRLRSLSPRGAKAASVLSPMSGDSSRVQQQRHAMRQQQQLQQLVDDGNSNENGSLSPKGALASSPFKRGRSRGRGAREKAVKDMEEMNDRFEKNEPNQPQPEQKQQRGRESSLSRLGSAISRGRSRRKQRNENTSPEKGTSPSSPQDGDENQHGQASLMAVQVQPPSSQLYSPLVSMPKKGITRSVTTQSTYSDEPLSHYDESIAGAPQDSANASGLKKKKSRRQRLQSTVMKHLKRTSSAGSRSFDSLDKKLRHRTSDATPVTDGSSTDRSGDVPTDGNESFNNSVSQESDRTSMTVYEDGSVASSYLHRQSSTGTASTTVSSMLPTPHAEGATSNLEWNPQMSLLNRMSALQRIESFSGEEDSDFSESQNGNADLEMEEIFYDPEEAYQSCSHSMFQNEMDNGEELDLSVVIDDIPSKDKKGKFLYRRKKSQDNMVGGMMKKNKEKDESSSRESELPEAGVKKKTRSRSLSLRRIISRGSDKKEQEREEALKQAMMNSQHYQELRRQQQQQEAEERSREKMLQRSMSVDAHRRRLGVEEDRGSSPQYRRSNSLPRNTDIAHNHALAALAAEAGRRHRDSTKEGSNQRRIVRRDSKEPTGRRASFESEDSSLSKSSHASSSKSRSRSRHKKKGKTNCLVCHQRVYSDSKVDFMDFRFCVDCFRCASCRKSLGELEEDDPFLSGAQVISNARGSIVQCGNCVMQLGRPKAEPSGQKSAPTVVSYIPTKGEAASINYCTLCKSDFSGYKGEVQCIGVNNYHTECLRREKGRADSIGSRSLGSEGAGDIVGQITPPSSVAGDELTPAGAAQDVADKAIVRITLADDDGGMEKSHLSNVFFVWPKKEEDLAEFEATEQDKKMEKFLRNDGCEVDLSVQVKYKLDMMKHQHNQFLTLPELDSDVDGRITEKFQIELEMPDRSKIAVPQPSGPALLSIEPFPRERDSAKKVLRATWSYECEGIQHEFRFIAPFNSPYGVAWEIFEGDELDFTSCKLECFIDKVEHPGMSETSLQQPSPKQRRRSSRTSTGSVCDWELRADELLDEVDDEKNNTTAIKRVLSAEENTLLIDTSIKSVDTSGRTSTEYSDGGSMLILHRKSRHVDPDREENDHFSELLSVASSADSRSISLPTIVHIAVEKHSDAEIGLSLIEKNGTTVVSEVSKSGLFWSKLKEGCALLSINGHKVRSPRSFIRMMKDFNGQIVIMASSSPPPPGAKFIVVKKTFVGGKDEEQDISFQKVNGILRVEGTKEAGIFAETDISQGDLCLSIDGVPAISENVAMRAFTRAQGNVALLMFPMSTFWKSMVELTIEDKYDRWWKSRSECVLFWGNDNSHPVNLSFNEETGLCVIQDNNDSDVRVKTMNTIILRVMTLLKDSIQSYITSPKKKRDSSRSLSVSPGGKLQNRSDVYKRALVKLDEMRENGRLSEADYASAKRALTEVAINS